MFLQLLCKFIDCWIALGGTLVNTIMLIVDRRSVNIRMTIVRSGWLLLLAINTFNPWKRFHGKSKPEANLSPNILMCPRNWIPYHIMTCCTQNRLKFWIWFSLEVSHLHGRMLFGSRNSWCLATSVSRTFKTAHRILRCSRRFCLGDLNFLAWWRPIVPMLSAQSLIR